MNYTVLSIQLCRKYWTIFDEIVIIKPKRCIIAICGIIILTLPVGIIHFFPMNQKHMNLHKAGLFNKNFHKINDPRFTQESAFFDPCDNLQVRYEMIRSHIVEGDSVSKLCKRFGVTRQTFYTLQEKLNNEGSAGLIQKKTGPHGPTKVHKTVLDFINEQIGNNEHLSAECLRNEITMKFGISLHKRTVEKIVRDMRLKKNFTSKKQYFCRY
jgi:transposase